MAKSTTTPPKSDNLTTFPAPESSVAVAEPPDTAAEVHEPEPQPAQPAPKGPGRPKKTDTPPESDFFQQVAAVRPTDWGTRVYLYLYQLEPVCDLKKSGGKAYLMRYEEPITDEHRVMIEQGSGRYRFILAKNKISPDASNELARYEFEVSNRNYPPKLPREAWVPDPRNRRWEALLPKESPNATPAAADTVLEAIRLGSELQKESRPQESSSEVLATMKLAKDLFATPAAATAAPAKDPLEIATALATTFMQMKADNPMVDFLRDQMKQQHEEMMAMRKELTEARALPAVAPKSILDQIFDLASDDAKLERIKKVAGIFGLSAADAGGSFRPARMTGLDLIKEIVNSPFGAQLGDGVGKLLQGLAAHGEAPQQPTTINVAPANGNASAPGTQRPAETDQQRIQRIAQVITNPMINEYFDQDEKGGVFAEHVYNFWPEDLGFMQKLGAVQIVNLYQQYNKPLWTYITADPTRGNREQQFRTFIAEFCAWQPEVDEKPAPVEDPDAVTDLEEESA